MRHAIRVLGEEEVLQQREVALEDELVVRIEVARWAAIEEQIAPGWGWCARLVQSAARVRVRVRARAGAVEQQIAPGWGQG